MAGWDDVFRLPLCDNRGSLKMVMAHGPMGRVCGYATHHLLNRAKKCAILFASRNVWHIAHKCVLG